MWSSSEGLGCQVRLQKRQVQVTYIWPLWPSITDMHEHVLIEQQAEVLEVLGTWKHVAA